MVRSIPDALRRRIGLRVSALALAFLVLAAFLPGCSRKAEAPEEFRIGLLAPISSSTNRFAAPRHAEDLVARINSTGGVEVAGRKVRVRLIVEDTGGHLERVMAAAGRLLQQERAAALVGPYYSREAIPAAAAAEAARVPLITPVATSPLVTHGRRFAFRVCLTDSAQARGLARFLYEDLGLHKAAVLYDEGEEYSAGLARYFKEALGVQGGGVVAMEPYPGGATDFRRQIARIKASGAQAVFLPNFPRTLALQLTQLASAGFKGVVLGSDSWDAERLHFGLPAAQGAFYSVDFAGTADMDRESALTLDALEMLFAAARAAGSLEPQALRDGLAGLRGFEGLTGRISFANGGEPEREVRIMKVVEGRGVLHRELSPDR